MRKLDSLKEYSKNLTGQDSIAVTLGEALGEIVDTIVTEIPTKIGIKDSNGVIYDIEVSTAGVLSASARETVSTPVLTESGTFTESKEVTITCATEGSTIYYTDDGSTPTAESTEYTGAITLTKTTTIKAIGIKPAAANSSVASATYTKSE